jgi:hypothetical protein
MAMFGYIDRDNEALWFRRQTPVLLQLRPELLTEIGIKFLQ